MIRVHVQVLQVDIDSGYRGNCAACPLALSIHRAIGIPVAVGEGDIFEYCEGNTWQECCGRRLATLPESAQRFLADFDDRRPVRPFGFYLWIKARDVLKGEPAGKEMVLSG